MTTFQNKVLKFPRVFGDDGLIPRLGLEGFGFPENLWDQGQWIERGSVIQKMRFTWSPGVFRNHKTEYVDVLAPVSGLYHEADGVEGSGYVLLPAGTDIPADINDMLYGRMIRFLRENPKALREYVYGNRALSDQDLERRLRLMENYKGWFCFFLPDEFADLFAETQPEFAPQFEALVNERRYLQDAEISASKSEAIKKLHDECRWRVNGLQHAGMDNTCLSDEEAKGPEVARWAAEAIAALRAASPGKELPRKPYKARSNLFDFRKDLTTEQQRCFMFRRYFVWLDYSRSCLHSHKSGKNYKPKTYSSKMLIQQYQEQISSARSRIVRGLEWYEALSPEAQERCGATHVFDIFDLNKSFPDEDERKYRDKYLEALESLCKKCDDPAAFRKQWNALNRLCSENHPGKASDARPHDYPDFEYEQRRARQKEEKQRRKKEEKAREREEKQQKQRRGEQESRERERRERAKSRQQENRRQRRTNSDNKAREIEEYLKVFQLEPGAGKRAVQYRFRQFSSRMHPDKGGSDYIQKLFLEARDYLLPRLHDEGPDWKPPEEWKRGGGSAKQEEQAERPRSRRQASNVPPAYTDAALKIMDRWGLEKGFSTTALEQKATHLVYEVPEEAVSFVCSDFETLLPFSVPD